jgi:hypothetical protein
MIYALAANLIKAAVRSELEVTLATSLETTDFRNSDIATLKEQLMPVGKSEDAARTGEEKKPFARPRGPARKAR